MSLCVFRIVHLACPVDGEERVLGNMRDVCAAKERFEYLPGRRV